MNPPDYKESYRKIAADHIKHWRETGSNPFQPDELVAEINDATRDFIVRHVPAGARVLDIGCGMGEVLAKCPQYERLGVDIVAEFLPIARENGVDAIEGEIEALPFPDEDFDAVLVLDILEHVLDLNAAVREALRVLRPGGHLVMRSPDSQDMSGYVDYWVYDYVHLRRLDEPQMRLLFERIFKQKVVEVGRVRDELIVVVQKQ